MSENHEWTAISIKSLGIWLNILQIANGLMVAMGAMPWTTAPSRRMEVPA